MSMAGAFLFGDKMDINQPINATEFEPVSGVYVIRNKVTARIYVGQSINIFARWNNHITDLSRGKHISATMQNDYNKHGASSFELEVIKLVEGKKKLLKEEKAQVLNRVKSGKTLYNASLGHWTNKTEKMARDRRREKIELGLLHSKEGQEPNEDGKEKRRSHTSIEGAVKKEKDLFQGRGVSVDQSSPYMEGSKPELYIEKASVRPGKKELDKSTETKRPKKQGMDENGRSRKGNRRTKKALSKGKDKSRVENESGDYVGEKGVSYDQWKEDTEAFSDWLDSAADISWFLRTYVEPTILNEVIEQVQKDSILYLPYELKHVINELGYEVDDFFQKWGSGQIKLEYEIVGD